MSKKTFADAPYEQRVEMLKSLFCPRVRTQPNPQDMRHPGQWDPKSGTFRQRQPTPIKVSEQPEGRAAARRRRQMERRQQKAAQQAEDAQECVAVLEVGTQDSAFRELSQPVELEPGEEVRSGRLGTYEIPSGYRPATAERPQTHEARVIASPYTILDEASEIPPDVWDKL